MLVLPFLNAVCSGPIISSNVGCILFARTFVYVLLSYLSRDIGCQLAMSSLSPFLYKQDITTCPILFEISLSSEMSMYSLCRSVLSIY